jgi:phosphatidylinositol 3-kinase
LLYLLQLVQALKFEHIDDKDEESYDSSLVQFLVDRATSNPVLGTYLHWYVMVECQDKSYGKMYAKVAYHFFSELLEVIISVYLTVVVCLILFFS